MEPHRRLDDELDTLRDRVLLLGGEAEAAVQKAVHSLVGRDTEAARAVMEGNDPIDRLEVEIGRLCNEVLALRQPAARDLRFVIAVAKITPVLERIADHACNIARAAIDLNDEPQLKPFADLPHMADIAMQQMRAALDAFTNGDAATARRLIGGGDEVGELYDRTFHELIRLMASDPTTITRAARLLLVAKHLERIGDYVTDICEQTVYMTEASIIKHSN